MGDLTGRQFGAMAAIAIEMIAMGGRIEQALGLELTFDFHQAIAQSAQQTDADRLIVDEGPRAAITGQLPAQDQTVIRLDSLVLQDRQRRMLVGQRKFGCDGGLGGTLPDQPGFGTSAQGQSQCVEQDGLAGPGLAGQDGEASIEGQIQLLDQHHILNGECDQHGCQALLWFRKSRSSKTQPSSRASDPWHGAGYRHPGTSRCPDSCNRAPPRRSAPRH